MKLNLRGSVFVVKEDTFLKYPNTVLGKLSRDSPEYREEQNDFFFNVNPVIFQDILDFYETGELHVSTNMCSSRILHEIKRWGIDICYLKPCCWSKVLGGSDAEDAFKQLSAIKTTSVVPLNIQHSDDCDEKKVNDNDQTANVTKFQRLKRRMQAIFNQPFRSKAGKVKYVSLKIRTVFNFVLQ